MRTPKLSNENKEQKQRLQKKFFKTKENKETLEKLKVKVSTPKQEVYEKEKEEALEKRWKVQKFFNRFYKAQEVPRAKKYEKNPIEGLLNATKNTRKPFNRLEAKKPNNTFPDPPNLQGAESQMVNGRRVDKAGQAVMVYINAPLLYALWKQEAPRPLEEISDEDFEQFINTVKRYNDKEDVARRVFHMPGGLEELEQWRKEHEEGVNYPSQLTVIDFEYQFPDGTRIEKPIIKVPGSVHAERVINDIRKGKKLIIDSVEADLITCPRLLDVNNIPSVRNSRGNYAPDIFKPLTTLKSNGCITLFTTNEMFESSDRFGNLPKSWMIVEKKFLKFTTQLPILAKYLKTPRFMQEIFDNWAIQGIDPALFELFQIKYPELAIKCSTYFLSTKDYAYEEKKLKFTENHIVLDKSVYPEEIGLTIKNPFQEDSQFYSLLQKAQRENKFYGMSPYIGYSMKKIALPFWKQIFNSPSSMENLRIYEGLTRPEQITVDFLQHLRFKDKLLGSDYNFAEAKNTYMDFLGEGTPTEGLIRKLVELYMSDYRKHKDQLEFFQTVVVRPYENELPRFDLTHKQAIEQILMKFKRPAPIRRPPNENNNNDYSPAEPVSLSPPRVLTRKLTARPVVNARRSVAPMRTRPPAYLTRKVESAFNRRATAETRNNVRRTAVQRMQELNAWMEQKAPQYEALVERYGTPAKLQAKVDFITRKLRYLRGNRNKLTQNEKNTLDNYGLMKQFEVAKSNRKQQTNILSRLPA